MSDAAAAQPLVARAVKKVYTSPRLVSYGRFAEIVQGQGGVKAEPGGPKAGPRSRV